MGHLRCALEIQQALGLDEVRLIPCHIPPHRPQPVATPEQRVAMLRAAVNGHPEFVIDERELGREGPSYTLDTLKSFHGEAGHPGLCLLLGMDSFHSLPTWHRWRELPDYAHIVVMTRPGSAFQEQGVLADFVSRHRVAGTDQFAKQAAGLLVFHSVTQLEISASCIRGLLASGQGADFLLPESVLEVIRNAGLYQQET
ncbi:MAG: nicotinate-nucleotide adenylyltransferase [Gammaproteobacteria bacterium]